MRFTNSPLVTVKHLSPNCTPDRTHVIDTITIHCAAGHTSAEALGNWFSGSGHWSANYGIGDDGDIGLYVEEKDRAWTSANTKNDDRAVTIEVACDPTPPYAVRPDAYRALIRLVADICKRNNIDKLLWENDKSLIGQVDKQNMTLHRWFVATACPGDWLVMHHPDIVREVNEILHPKAETHFYRVQVGAFKDKKNADHLKEKLQRMGYKDAFVLEVRR